MNIGLIRMRHTPYGGAEVFASRFIEGLIEKGHICHIFASEWNSADKKGLRFHKVAIIRGLSFLKVLSFAINSYRAVKKEHLDMIISFDKTLCQDIYRAGDGCHREWLFQRSKIISPFKRLFTHISPLHIAHLFLERRLLTSKRLRFIIANSNRVKEDLIKHYKLPDEKIYVIYNGINLKKFNLAKRDELRKTYRTSFGFSPDHIVLLFVGSGFERKGLLYLMKALASLIKNEKVAFKLLVVGKGNINKYRKISNKIGIGDDVIFAGPVEDTLGYYFAGDIFVLPTIYEPFSNACIEGMAACLPIVTSRINGASEILSDEVDGSIIESPTNPDDIVKGLIPFIDAKKRRLAGIAARKKVEEYTIERNVNKFIELINTAI